MTTKKFKNRRWEYTTREFSTDVSAIHPSWEKDLEAEGWWRVWADITQEGTFVVYRRMKPNVRVR